MDAAVDISSLFQTTSVSVVQAIDAGKLEALLKWLVEKCTKGSGAAAAPGADPALFGSLQEQIDNLRRDNTALKSDLDGAKSKLVSAWASLAPLRTARTTSGYLPARPCQRGRQA